ncbi:hypothetical protein D929_00031 [Enterococcus faecalis 02-MB-P-10]|uniref:hypothetical protein n=1 Tax=Enterococcus faecalis TaxID=1351 RepID=UPI000353EF45|nr:hypothetical protein [Enterococcus faecalis]EPH77774.1 hypothetical protein D929_00031 [Enterococcus faecalis 02-MB-P-10]
MDKQEEREETLQEKYHDSVLQRGMGQDKWQRAYEGVDFPSPEFTYYPYVLEEISQRKNDRY